MLPGGKIQQVRQDDVSLGRRLLCKEDPKTRATSKCAKLLAQTVNKAKRGLTADQLKLWRQMVYTPAVLMLARHCVLRRPVRACNPWDVDACPGPVSYPRCSELVFSGAFKFQGPFGMKYKWSDYLTKGAAMIKQVKPDSWCKILPPSGSATTKPVNKSTSKGSTKSERKKDEPGSGGNPAGDEKSSPFTIKPAG